MSELWDVWLFNREDGGLEDTFRGVSSEDAERLRREHEATSDVEVRPNSGWNDNDYR